MEKPDDNDEQSEFSKIEEISESSENDKDSNNTAIFGKEFVLKHVFRNVSSMVEDATVFSNEEEHFGVPWQCYVTRTKEHISFFLQTLLVKKEEEEWTIDTLRKMTITSSTGKSHSLCSERIFESTDQDAAWGWKAFLKWDELIKDYVLDDSITVEIHVMIKNMRGIYKENLRHFDESMEECSDVVLIVNEQKFFVSKLFLVTHSPYFKVLFLGQFHESKKAEISLSGIDSDDFQNYLEVLYGDPAIDETTVEGILVVADMYDTQIVVGKCEDFLMKESKKSMKKKLEMATRYNLDKLKKNCLSEIKTVGQIKAVIPGNICDMDHSIMAKLFEKSLSFQ